MSKKLSLEEFIIRARLIHGDKYDYTKSQYNGMDNKINIMCPIHSEFYQSPINHLQGKGCVKCGATQISDSKYFTKEEFIKRANSVHDNKYDYSKSDYKHSQEKIIITCLIHGDFEQRANAHLLGQGCPSCMAYNNFLLFKSNIDKFIQKAKEVHGDKYDYSKVTYINNQTKVTIICPVHGEFSQRPKDHLNRQGCPGCKKSKGERFIETILNKNNIYALTEYKLPEVVNRFEYDFYLPDYRTLIEFHGKQHYEPIEFFGGEDNLSYIKRNDEFKKHLANRYKYRLLEFNYRQFKHMPAEQFEQLIINSIIS